MKLPQGWKEILKIAWPLIVANSFWNLQITVDRVFLANFSTEALGASMAAAGIFWAPMALAQQSAAYVTTFIAQYFGAKQEKMVGPSVWHSFYISIIGGLVFLLAIPFVDDFFKTIGHSPELQVLEADYFKALCWSAMPTALVAAVSGFYTGLGRSSLIIWINAVGLIVNAVLGYLMIFGKFGFPQMGITGAGYATALANWAAAFFGIYLLFDKKHEEKYAVLSGWRLNLDLLKRYFIYGIPSGMQWALEGLAFTVFLIFIGRLPSGEAALAASSVVVTIMMLAILPTLGVAQAVMVLVGQNLGNQRTDLAEVAAWKGLQIAATYIACIAASFFIFPNFYIGWFANNENQALWEQTRTMAQYLLMFVAVFTNFDSMNLIFSFAVKGAGDTRFITLMSLLLPWPLMVLPTWLVSHRLDGVYFAWLAASIYIIIQAIVSWRRFASGKWKSMSVIRST